MKKLTLFFSLFITLPAISGIFVEPYIGAGKSISDNIRIQREGTSFDSFFINPGLKIGTTRLLRLVSAGVELSHQSSSAESPSQGELDLTRMDYGIFAGIDLPVLFRFFGKFIFDSDMKIGNAEIVDPSGYGLGVGYKGMPFLSLNLEYRNISWNKTIIDDTESNNDGDISEIILTLSLPLKL